MLKFSFVPGLGGNSEKAGGASSFILKKNNEEVLNISAPGGPSSGSPAGTDGSDSTKHPFNDSSLPLIGGNGGGGYQNGKIGKGGLSSGGDGGQRDADGGKAKGPCAGGGGAGAPPNSSSSLRNGGQGGPGIGYFRWRIQL